MKNLFLKVIRDDELQTEVRTLRNSLVFRFVLFRSPGFTVTLSLSPPQTHTFKGLNAEGNHLSRRALQAQHESLMSSLLTLYFHTHSHLLGFCSEGQAIFRVCQLSLTRAQMSRLWPCSNPPNLIWWLNYGFILEILPGVRGDGAGSLSLRAQLTWSITVTVPVGLSPCRSTSLLCGAITGKTRNKKPPDLAAPPSPPGDAYHIFWANWENEEKWNKEDPNIWSYVDVQLWHAHVFRYFICPG